jgi:pyridoxamine 5'-phosphate oxidase
MPDVRATLRALPVLTGAAPAFDPTCALDDPVALFVEWFTAAVDAGVPEPHAMTLSTTDEHGTPDARMLILKDVDAVGWHFAVSAASRKGAQLGSNPVAALTFYWPAVVRQVRVRGPVTADPPEVTAADFLARSAGARALALMLRQSQTLTDTADLDVALAKARAELEADPARVPDEWVSYAVAPERVEFWQGDPERRHQRLLYTADLDAPGGWSRTRLWP